jgi:hypothetical protein
MQEHSDDEILIVPMPVEEALSEEEGYEPLRGDERENKRAVKAVPARLSKLSANLHEFLSQVETLLHEIPETLAEFKLEEIEVSAGLTASGKFVLFGIGAEGGIEGGLRFAFRRTARDN